MIKGIDNTLKWFEKTGVRHWKIYSIGKTDSGNPVLMSNQDGTNTSNSYTDLKDALHLLHGRYTLIACDEAGKLSPKGNFKEDIEIFDTPANALSPAPVISGVAPEDVEAKINKAVADAIEKHTAQKKAEELQKENEELKKQLKEMEKESSSALNKVIGAIGNYVLPFFDAGKPAQVAGIPPGANHVPENGHVEENVIHLTPEEQERLGHIVAKLYIIAPGGVWLEKLEVLTGIVEKNPDLLNKIDSLKMFL